MPKTFRVGDHVRWNSEARRVSCVLKEIASDTKVEGYVHHASQEAPQYLNKSDKTVHVAIRKGNAPRLISSPATNLSKTKETTSRGIYEIAEINTRKQIEVCTKAFCSRRARGDIHLQANLGYDGHEGELGALGFESATLDHMFRLTYARGIPGSRTPYGPAALNTIRVWKEGAAKVTVPYFADCPVGWDDSAGYGSSPAMVTQRLRNNINACSALLSTSRPRVLPAQMLSFCRLGTSGRRIMCFCQIRSSAI